LLPYRRLKIFAIFAAVSSLESIGMQQLRQYATTLVVSNFALRILYILSSFPVDFFSASLTKNCIFFGGLFPALSTKDGVFFG
jgi:hypothetical protein